VSSSSNHFSLEAEGTPTAAGLFVDRSMIEGVELIDGLTFQPAMGQNVLANFVTYEPNSVAPMHVHVEEQVVIVIDGEFEFTLDGEVKTMKAGDIAIIPPWVPHGAKAGANGCRQVDVFTPARSTLVGIAHRVPPVG
jgi:quercetin dioxygenase-like cupin family protein